MWGVQGFFTPVCIGLLVATIWTYCSAKKSKKVIDSDTAMTECGAVTTCGVIAAETEELNESNSNEQVDGGSTPSTCSTGDAENC